MRSIAAHDRSVSIGAGALWMDANDGGTTKGGRYLQGGGCALASTFNGFGTDRSSISLCIL